MTGKYLNLRAGGSTRGRRVKLKLSQLASVLPDLSSSTDPKAPGQPTTSPVHYSLHITGLSLALSGLEAGLEIVNGVEKYEI